MYTMPWQQIAVGHPLDWDGFEMRAEGTAVKTLLLKSTADRSFSNQPFPVNNLQTPRARSKEGHETEVFVL